MGEEKDKPEKKETPPPSRTDYKSKIDYIKFKGGLQVTGGKEK